MNQKEARAYGYGRGYDCAIQLGVDNPGWSQDELSDESSESEQNSRQYAEWCAFASRVNALPEWRADATWTAYEGAVGRGISAGVREVMRTRRKRA